MKSVMDKLEKLCIKWLNENFNPMEPFFMKEYPNYIFHMKDGKCILQHNKKNGYVYVSYREIWKFFESYFSMTNQQIKDITKIWVEEHYKVGVTTTSCYLSVISKMVEEHYKVGVTTTLLLNYNSTILVEEHYKVGVTTTISHWKRMVRMVEEHYKVGVTTTSSSNQVTEYQVEEHYKVGVTTTKVYKLLNEYWVEEHYKVGVTATRLSRNNYSKVEEQYKIGVTSIQEFGCRLQKEVDEQNITMSPTLMSGTY